jgi:hypothetical protein
VKKDAKWIIYSKEVKTTAQENAEEKQRLHATIKEKTGKI